MNIYMIKKPKRINSVSVSLTLILATLGYLGWFYVPVRWPIFQLKGIMRATCNDAYREYNNEKLMKRLLSDARRTGLNLSPANFRLTRIPFTHEEMIAQKMKPGDLTASRGKECILEMHYEDDYEWPLIGKTTRIVFEDKVSAPLEYIKWEKQCTCVTVGD